MADYIAPAPTGFTVLTVEGDHWVVEECIIAFDYCVNGAPWPITPSRGKITSGYLVKYPNGSIYSRDRNARFESMAEFEAEGGWDGSVSAPSSGKTFPTLASMGLSGRATMPLQRELNVVTVGDLASHERAAVAAVRGVSRQAIKDMDGWLSANGLTWGGGIPEPETETVSDDDDDLEDIF